MNNVKLNVAGYKFYAGSLQLYGQEIPIVWDNLRVAYLSLIMYLVKSDDSLTSGNSKVTAHTSL